MSDMMQAMATFIGQDWNVASEDAKYLKLWNK